MLAVMEVYAVVPDATAMEHSALCLVMIVIISEACKDASESCFAELLHAQSRAPAYSWLF